MDCMLAELNAAQHTAVTSPAAVLQILAPPGSGKTKTLTSRVAYLLSHHNYKPWNILCLTFTIKSSREMEERIAKLIGNGMEAKLILGTFHSVCRRYLARYGHLIGLRTGFGIADSSDTVSIIKRIVKRHRLQIDAKKAQSRISSTKSKGITCEELEKAEGHKKNVDQQEFIRVFQAYQEHLEQSNLLDYDDLLLRCVDLLRQHPACVSNVEVVLIDEFQDTNVVQFDLMRLFAGKNKRVTTVGDPDQSIYGWRSAEIKNLKRMRTQYPDTLVIHLEDNYRSSGAIILAAREVIEQDESRIPRPLLPTHCPGTVPVLRRLPTAEIEGLWVVSEIERVTALSGRLLDHSDFAVLLRSASLSRQIEAAMGKAGIPYRMVGGQRFFDRLEIKILLDYLRVINQPYHNDALARIINVPARGIGPATVKSLLETAETSRMTLWQLVRHAVQGNAGSRVKISKSAEQGLGNLIRIILTATGKLASMTNPQSPEDLLRYITKKLDFEEYLKKTHEQDYDSRWANVEELLAQAADYPVTSGQDSSLQSPDDETLPVIENLEQNMSNAGEEALSRFLANVALATEIQREDESDEAGSMPQSRVTISTVHAAKGLEWPVIFIPSAYEGSIPHSRAEDTDEERRLLYVAMTRAQALLYISCPVNNSQREETTISRFLSSKEVGHFLVKKGPSFNMSTIQDMARILRRDYPAEKAIISHSSVAKSLEDDQWPLDGSEAPKGGERRWNKWSTTNDDLDRHHPSKRRRMLSPTDPNLTRIPAAQPDLYAISTNSTTMQNTSTFSYVAHAGFTTAASQLQVIEAEVAISLKTTIIPRNDTTTSKKSNKASSSTKRHAGQSSLATFFEKKNSADIGPKPSPQDKRPKPQRAEPMRGQTREDSSLSRQCIPRTTIAPTNLLINEAVVPTPRLPLASIPQPLSSHRFQPLTSTRPRPFPTTSTVPSHNEPPPNPYPFLSSSPPKPSDPAPHDRENDRLKNSTTDSSHVKIIGGNYDVDHWKQWNEAKDIQLSQKVNEEQEPKDARQRPATTFHTTSMQQVGNGRRTLGVKRSMGGWAARGKGKGGGGFEVPRRIG